MRCVSPLFIVACASSLTLIPFLVAHTLSPQGYSAGVAFVFGLVWGGLCYFWIVRGRWRR